MILMNLRYLVLSFVLLPTSAWSQSLIDRFRDHIPPRLLQDEQSKSQIEGFLYSSSTLHPELIYFQLLRLSTLDSARSNYAFVSDVVNSITQEYTNKRRLWAHRILDNLSNRPSSPSVTEAKEVLLPLLNPGFTQNNQFIPIEVDSLRLNNIVACFYSAELDDAANPEIILEKRRESENARRSILITRVNTGPGGDQSLVSELTNAWYLFPVDSSATHFADLLVQAIAQQYIAKKSWEAAFSIGMLEYMRKPEYSLDGPDTLKRHQFEIPYISTGLSFSIAGKYFFSSSPGLFSYLNLRFTYSSHSTSGVMSFRKNNSLPIYAFSISPDVIEQFEYPLEKPIKTSLKTVLLAVSAPILSYRSLIVVEPLIWLGRSYFSYSINYSFSYAKYRHDNFRNIEYLAGSGGIMDENRRFSQDILTFGIELSIRPIANTVIGVTVVPNRFHLLTSYAI